MRDILLPWCQWLETTSIGLMVRESLWGFQIVVTIHILGLVFSVGLLLWFDLRLLGIGVNRVRVTALYRALIPWASIGFVSMFVTGAMLFTGFATAAIGNVFFRTKMLTLTLAACNAFVYHLITERRIQTWDSDVHLPTSARVAGLVSVVLWAGVILCGRLMSYTMF